MSVGTFSFPALKEPKDGTKIEIARYNPLKFASTRRWCLRRLSLRALDPQHGETDASWKTAPEARGHTRALCQR